LSSRKTGSDVFVGLFSDERPLRKVSPGAEVDKATSVGSAELMLLRYIRAIAIAGFCALPKWKKRTSAQLVPPWYPRSADWARARRLEAHEYGRPRGAGNSDSRCRGVFRVLYVAKFDDAIYVLHCFQKKTQKTSKADLNLAAQRYRDLLKELDQ
jgi:hypothetical protein